MDRKKFDKMSVKTQININKISNITFLRITSFTCPIVYIKISELKSYVF